MSASTDQHNTVHQHNTVRADLTEVVTCLGRPSPEELGPAYINLDLEGQFKHISRKHAQIIRQETAYILSNWMGQLKIGLYERSLAQGDSHHLRHCDIFRIPDVEGPFVRIIFLVGDQTRVLPLEVEYERRKVHVFGEEVRLTPLEYRVLVYLHRHAGGMCSYDELIESVWQEGYSEDRKRHLDVLLTQIRGKIRTVSGGFTFLETIRDEGIRLVL